MSDLISRTKIRNYIKEQINPYGKPFEGTVYEFGLKLMDYIDNMLDAYNVDAVVAELEDYREEARQFGVSGMLTDIIEVARKGGVE